MPVLLDGGAGGLRLFAATEHARGRERPKFRATDPDCIVLGLVNNMPDLALEQTERQVLQLLDEAAGHLIVCLRLYALPDVPRGDLGRKHLHRLHYRNIDELLNGKLDGVIITGAEPQSPDLMQEPYWDSLTEVFRLGGAQYGLHDYIMLGGSRCGASLRWYRSTSTRSKVLRSV